MHAPAHTHAHTQLEGTHTHDGAHDVHAHTRTHDAPEVRVGAPRDAPSYLADARGPERARTRTHADLETGDTLTMYTHMRPHMGPHVPTHT